MNSTTQLIPAGLGQTERMRLSKLLRATKVTISVAEAASALGLEPKQAAKLLSWYTKKGWLNRISQGLYLPVPLESATSDIVAEEPFVIAEKLFAPCYIGGMNAANYWELTEQIFRTVTVMTQNKVKNRQPKIGGTEYDIHSIKPEYFYGLKSIWLTGVKVQISDPTRTILDMVLFPQFCGGIRFVMDVIQSYFQSKHKDIDLLIKYLEKAQNGAAIKRLGFIIEKYYPDEEKLINYCLQNLTQGYIRISPNLESPRLIRRWRLWVPENFKEVIND
ncbi:MAG: type IV toxin-antitoxin system AbiEi family antitoxin domain-containing protein [Candidatus Berkiella sp.]